MPARTDVRENHDCHCWIILNSEDWYIGAIEMDWKTGKQWMRLWREEPGEAGQRNTAFVSVDMSRVNWDDYCRIACEMIQEQIDRQMQTPTEKQKWKRRGTTSKKIASSRSPTTKLLN